ncbi:hypothetical protein [Aureibacillus halotolerans]|uniref:Uncharacterized protein n=1 Tax=Aureibacillus halotolerans TaxID=1508390 RepID=A0A4R6TXU6_9BACI|nr:hypothetical protein [Aureibacillus halotolerans]TDQ38381.1 hypothetical protein EV213_110128 [Aureibacillus halotolerans]
MKLKEKNLWAIIILLVIFSAVYIVQYGMEVSKVISTQDLFKELFLSNGAEDFESEVTDEKLDALVDFVQKTPNLKYENVFRIEGPDVTYVVNYWNSENRELQITDVTVVERDEGDSER